MRGWGMPSRSVLMYCPHSACSQPITVMVRCKEACDHRHYIRVRVRFRVRARVRVRVRVTVTVRVRVRRN